MLPSTSKQWRKQLWDEFERVAREEGRKDADPQDVIEMLRKAATNKLRRAPSDDRMQRLVKSLYIVRAETVPTMDNTPTHQESARLPSFDLQLPNSPSSLSPNSQRNKNNLSPKCEKSPPRRSPRHLNPETIPEESQWRRTAIHAREEIERLRLTLQEPERNTAVVKSTVISLHERAEKREILYTLVEEVEKAVASGNIDNVGARTFRFLAKEVGMFWRPQQGKHVTASRVYGWLLEKGVRRGARVDIKFGSQTSQTSYLSDMCSVLPESPRHLSDWLRLAFRTLQDKSSEVLSRFRALSGEKMPRAMFVTLVRAFVQDVKDENELCEVFDRENKGHVCLDDVVDILSEDVTSARSNLRRLWKFQKTCNLAFPDLHSLFQQFSKNGDTLTFVDFNTLCAHVDKDAMVEPLWRMATKGAKELSRVAFRLFIYEDHIITFRNPDIYTAAIWPWIDRIPVYKEVSTYISKCVAENVKRRRTKSRVEVDRQDSACSALPLRVMRQNAGVIKIKYDSLCRQMAELTDGTFHPASIKKPERAQIKAMIKYGGDKSHLCDLVRGSICYPGIEAMYRALRFIISWEHVQQQSTFVISFEDRVQQPLVGGYRDCQLMIRVDDHTCELQLHLQDVFDAKSHLKGHFAYEVARKRNEGILLAAMLNCPDAARRLIEAKGSANAVKDKNKLSALHYAAMYGEMEMIELLIHQGHGAVSFADQLGHLPMYRAVMHKHWPAAQYLCAHLLTASRQWCTTFLHQRARLEMSNVGNSVQSMLFSLVEFCPEDQLNLITVLADTLSFCRARTSESTEAASREVRGRSVPHPLPLSLDMLLQCDSGGRTLLHMCASRNKAPGSALRTIVDACAKHNVPISAKALCIDFQGRSAWSLAQEMNSVAVDEDSDEDGGLISPSETKLLRSTLRELMDIEIARRELKFAHFKVRRDVQLSKGRLSQNGLDTVEEAQRCAAECMSAAQCSSKTRLIDARLAMEGALQKARTSSVLCRRLSLLSNMEDGRECNAWSMERLVTNGFSHEEASFIMTDVFEGKTKVQDQWHIIRLHKTVSQPDGVNQLRSAFLKKLGADNNFLCQLVALHHGDHTGSLTKEAFFNLAPTALEEDWLSLPKQADGRANLRLVERESQVDRMETLVDTGSEYLAHFMAGVETLLDHNSRCVDMFQVFDVRAENRIHAIDVAELLSNVMHAQNDTVWSLWEGMRGNFEPVTYDEFKTSFVDPAFAPLLLDKIDEVTQCLLNLGVSSSRRTIQFFAGKKSADHHATISYGQFFRTIANAVFSSGRAAFHVLALWPQALPLDQALSPQQLLSSVWNVNDGYAQAQVNPLGVEFGDGKRQTVSAEMENAAWVIQKRMRARRDSRAISLKSVDHAKLSPILESPKRPRRKLKVSRQSEWEKSPRYTELEVEPRESNRETVGALSFYSFMDDGDDVAFARETSFGPMAPSPDNSSRLTRYQSLPKETPRDMVPALSPNHMSEYEKQLFLAFQLRDEDNAGELDLPEFADALESAGMVMSEEECHELCTEMGLYAVNGTSIVYSRYLAVTSTSVQLH